MRPSTPTVSIRSDAATRAVKGAACRQRPWGSIVQLTGLAVRVFSAFRRSLALLVCPDSDRLTHRRVYE
jgi:hypothetical protein